MFNNLNGWHLLIIIAVVLLLFGAPKLPGLAKSLGQSMRIFRSEVKQMKDESDEEKSAGHAKSPSSPSVKAKSSSTPSSKTKS